ncbi:lambda exonuclease family protein [Rhodovarius lipocyclicus]|uniref:lambda exonuclease family protein n=1 Tax=Rhodovarius lipocyclicus TaxID=268410 RepID=UPI00135BC6D7|nr:lambda exonuclease family protein [Rhodovarius lipocyclicus]
MTITYHPEVIQGSEEWLALRCGLLTASEMKLIVTPSLKPAANDKQRAHLFELVAQRISGFVEPTYIGDDMLRGQDDEIEARQRYADAYAPVTACGFVTNDEWGFTLGCSPDGLVGDDGLIEIKSRRQKFQVATICARQMPDDYVMQVQTALLVTGRAWCDFISYSGGLPMVTLRVYPDKRIQASIIHAATMFEEAASQLVETYRANLEADDLRWLPTERRPEEIIL